ncbi:MAG: tetratricopeptide repeat protein [Acinetobacter sp.]
MYKRCVIGLGLIGLVGCQSLPTPETQKQKPSPSPSEKKEVNTPSGVIITPYDREEIQRKKMQVVIPEQRSRQQFDDGRKLPAFKKLMQKTQLAYKQGQWNQAEAAALQAQRLAPQSAETYLYLALVANKKNKPANAEALAQRGLSYAQSNAMKKQLWLAILKAAQQQKDQKTIQQAQTALKGL